MITAEQALYLKEYVTLKNEGDNISRIGTSLYDSKIALNPHQITAALSFFKNPLLKGLILADEVGLGKTIEAGLIISQYWYEHKRKILVIVPASLTKQWNEELFDKFGLPSTIINGKMLNDMNFRLDNQIYICSLNSIYLHKEKFQTSFNLVVIDEAHKLRNVYKDKGVMAPAIKEVFNGQKKLLLTATPFQNNLMELFGIVSLLDNDIFPDAKLFKEKYINNYSENINNLKEILSKYLVRTLRKDVTKYINYTKRHVVISDYYVTEAEQELYNYITNIMYSDDFSESYSRGQNQLLIILLQKLLSSSMYAVASTLKKMANNLDINDFEDFVDEDEEVPKLDLTAKAGLIANINRCLDYANSIKVDSKYERLLKELNIIFEDFDKNRNRNKKVLIFTESKQTQKYLYELLKQTEKFNNVIYFNGENSLTNENLYIYKEWERKQKAVSQNKTANVRRAIIDAFENRFDILIATDAAAEGLNMQFCSVVINYDLPWNPQKIEQRIGRCHRYGQKNDVLIVNMLNRSSSIDERIYELLNYKLGIFEETFGSSDTILGGTNIANDIENAIKEIYIKCRNPIEIENEFKNLQKQFEQEIEQAVKKSELDLQEYFDEEVRQAFDLQFIEATKIVNEIEEIFELLIEYVFSNIKIENHKFKLNNTVYTTNSNDEVGEFCAINSKIGNEVIEQIKQIENTNHKIIFDYQNSLTKIGFLDGIKCNKGKMVIQKIIYDSFETTEGLVIYSKLEDGTIIPQDVMHKLLKCNAVNNNTQIVSESIENESMELVEKKIDEIKQYNTSIFNDELNYIDNWADNMIEKIQINVQAMRNEKRELQLQYSISDDINTQTKIQEEINSLSRKISKSWLELSEKENEIEDRRATLIKNLKAENERKITINKLFEVEFEIA